MDCWSCTYGERQVTVAAFINSFRQLFHICDWKEAIASELYSSHLVIWLKFSCFPAGGSSELGTMLKMWFQKQVHALTSVGQTQALTWPESQSNCKINSSRGTKRLYHTALFVQTVLERWWFSCMILYRMLFLLLLNCTALNRDVPVSLSDINRPNKITATPKIPIASRNGKLSCPVCMI